MKHLILWEIKQNNRIFKKWLFDCFVLLLIGTLKKYIGKVSIVGENRNFKLVSRNCCWAVSFGCIWPVHATWRTVCKQKRWTRLKGSFSKKLRCSLIAWSREGEGGGVRVSNIRKWMESLWTLLFPLPPIKYDQKSSQRTRRAAESARTFSNLLFYETWRVSGCVPHLNYRSGSGEVFYAAVVQGGLYLCETVRWPPRVHLLSGSDWSEISGVTCFLSGSSCGSGLGLLSAVPLGRGSINWPRCRRSHHLPGRSCEVCCTPSASWRLTCTSA